MRSDPRPAAAGRRHDVLRVLKAANGPRSITQIATSLGVHPNTVRFHLDTLVENGQVERAPSDRDRPGRPPSLFRARRGMDRTGPRHYRLLAEILAENLAAEPDPGARAVAAGHAWGRGLAAATSGASREQRPVGRGDGGDITGPAEPAERLVRLLDYLGFAPDPPDTATSAGADLRVGLRHCPFLDLAETTARVVCPIHLGVMRGALEAWAAPLTVDRLEPFAEPDLCLAHLVPVRAGS